MFIPENLRKFSGHGFMQPVAKGLQRHGAFVNAVLPDGNRTFGDFFLTHDRKDRDPEKREYRNFSDIHKLFLHNPHIFR